MPRETVGDRGRMEEQSYDPICTCEGGEPQGFRKERPRYPLEGCERKLNWVRQQVQRQWISALNRRGQRRRTNWTRLKDRPWFKLPFAQNLHPMV